MWPRPDGKLGQSTIKSRKRSQRVVLGKRKDRKATAERREFLHWKVRESRGGRERLHIIRTLLNDRENKKKRGRK